MLMGLPSLCGSAFFHNSCETHQDECGPNVAVSVSVFGTVPSHFPVFGTMPCHFSVFRTGPNHFSVFGTVPSHVSAFGNMPNHRRSRPNMVRLTIGENPMVIHQLKAVGSIFSAASSLHQSKS